MRQIRSIFVKIHGEIKRYKRCKLFKVNDAKLNYKHVFCKYEHFVVV